MKIKVLNYKICDIIFSFAKQSVHDKTLTKVFENT